MVNGRICSFFGNRCSSPAPSISTGPLSPGAHLECANHDTAGRGVRGSNSRNPRSVATGAPILSRHKADAPRRQNNNSSMANALRAADFCRQKSMSRHPATNVAKRTVSRLAGPPRGPGERPSGLVLRPESVALRLTEAYERLNRRPTPPRSDSPRPGPSCERATGTSAGRQDNSRRGKGCRRPSRRAAPTRPA